MHQRFIIGKKFLGFFLTATLVLLAASPLLWAKDGVIHTKDGRVLEGDIAQSDSPDVVVITIHGVQTTLARADIDSIEYPQSIEQDYKDRAALITPGDANGHLDLARWLLDKKAYRLAFQEVIAAQKIDPNNRDAGTLYNTIVLQQRLAAPAHPGPANPAPTAGGPPSATPGTTNPSPAAPKFLSADEINALRQGEWKESDNNVRIRFEKDVLKRFLDMSEMAVADKTKFMAQSDAQKGWQIHSQKPVLCKDVRLLTDPSALAEYRGKIQVLALATCATAGCHGGTTPPGNGKLFLYSPADNEAATYTNFYILSTFNSKAGRVIDRTLPDQSLLLQYALPAALADIAHPPTAKGVAWKGVFTGKEDPRYKVLRNWIANSLVAIEPTYGITFTLDKTPPPPATLPAAPASTQPETPTTAPAPAPDMGAQTPAPAPAPTPDVPPTPQPEPPRR